MDELYGFILCRTENYERIKVGDSVRLVPDDENRFSSDAVKGVIETDKGEELAGYLCLSESTKEAENSLQTAFYGI